VLDPARVHVPTLVIYGDRDINVPPPDGPRFLARLAATDKQLVELKGAGHAAQLEDTHDAWVSAVAAFLSKPRR
jgi:pimeloyl-ACP methyl ester carboxylesterase